MKCHDIFLDYDRHHWDVNSLPWDTLRRDAVTSELISFVKGALMGEGNVIAALHGYLNEAQHDYDFSAYSAIWSGQEFRHQVALRRWLVSVGADLSMARVETTREAYPPGITHAATLATNIINELNVCHMYHEVAQRTEEPVLKEVLTRASQDEARHARDFRYYTRRRLESHPGELGSVLETLFVYMGDPNRLVKHAVSAVKGHRAEDTKGVHADDALSYYTAVAGDGLIRLRNKIFSTFSELTGYTLDTPPSIRRALRQVYAAAEAS